jgi:hypothetical protein
MRRAAVTMRKTTPPNEADRRRELGRRFKATVEDLVELVRQCAHRGGALLVVHYDQEGGKRWRHGSLVKAFRPPPILIDRDGTRPGTGAITKVAPVRASSAPVPDSPRRYITRQKPDAAVFDLARNPDAPMSLEDYELAVREPTSSQLLQVFGVACEFGEEPVPPADPVQMVEVKPHIYLNLNYLLGLVLRLGTTVPTAPTPLPTALDTLTRHPQPRAVQAKWPPRKKRKWRLVGEVVGSFRGDTKQRTSGKRRMPKRPDYLDDPIANEFDVETVVILRFETWAACTPEWTWYPPPPDAPGIFPFLTVEENLMMDGASARKDLLETIFGNFPALKTRLCRRAGLLSDDEQQMLAVNVALMRFRLLPRSFEGPRVPEGEAWIKSWITAIAYKVTERWGGQRVRRSDRGLDVDDVAQAGWAGIDVGTNGVVRFTGGFIEVRKRVDPAKGTLKAFTGIAVCRGCYAYLRWQCTIKTVPKNLYDYRHYQESGMARRPVVLDEVRVKFLEDGSGETRSQHELVASPGGEGAPPPWKTEDAEALAKQVLRGRDLQIMLELLRLKQPKQIAHELGISRSRISEAKKRAVDLMRQAAPNNDLLRRFRVIKQEDDIYRRDMERDE